MIDDATATYVNILFDLWSSRHLSPDLNYPCQDGDIPSFNLVAEK